jgi:hypothetical protein
MGWSCFVSDITEYGWHGGKRLAGDTRFIRLLRAPEIDGGHCSLRDPSPTSTMMETQNV